VRHATHPWGWLAAITTIALLLGFGRVVHQITDRGAERHAAERDRHSATWRCQLLTTRQARTDCRLALN
jgi:hypothetical protein